MTRKVVNGALATRRIAVLALVANTVLWGSYQAVTRDIVQRMPPLDFAVAEQASLLPCILVLLVLTRRQMTARVIRAGLLSGALLAAVVLLTMVALRYTTASEAAFFPAFNGLFAALIARVLLGTAVHRYTWGAAALAVIGALLLAGQTASSGERLGDALAFAGAFVYTGYVFRVDRDTGDSRLPAVPLLAIELLVSLAGAVIAALMWGAPVRWAAVQTLDIVGAIYVGYATMLIPTAVAILLQHHVAPLSVSFIYILEPVWGVLFAIAYLHERPTAVTLLGGGLIIVASLLHWSAALDRRSKAARHGAATAARLPDEEGSRCDGPRRDRPNTSDSAFCAVE